jgi:hypothetical protein
MSNLFWISKQEVQRGRLGKPKHSLQILIKKPHFFPLFLSYTHSTILQLFFFFSIYIYTNNNNIIIEQFFFLLEGSLLDKTRCLVQMKPVFLIYVTRSILYLIKCDVQPPPN